MVYPIALHIKGRRCLLVGGGSVALRKALTLLAEGADVTVISPEFHPDFASLTVNHIHDVYRETTLHQIRPLLVFAATNNEAINRQIVSDAQAAGMLVSTADNSSEDDFSNMITLDKAPITVAISTGFASPVLGQSLRDEIDSLMGDHYPTLATWLADLRQSVKEKVGSIARRRDFWRTVMASDILGLLRQGQIESARSLLDDLYDEAVGESA